MRTVLLLAALALPSCTLIDQNTFNPSAGAAPVIPPAPIKPVIVQSGPPPLLTIAPGAQPQEYGFTLRKAVADARARKPGVVFDVVEMEAPDADPNQVLGEGAAAIARAIVAEGVLPGRVRLAARPDAAAPPREVRVFVR